MHDCHLINPVRKIMHFILHPKDISFINIFEKSFMKIKHKHQLLMPQNGCIVSTKCCSKGVYLIIFLGMFSFWYLTFSNSVLWSLVTPHTWKMQSNFKRKTISWLDSDISKQPIHVNWVSIHIQKHTCKISKRSYAIMITETKLRGLIYAYTNLQTLVMSLLFSLNTAPPVNMFKSIILILSNHNCTLKQRFISSHSAW